MINKEGCGFSKLIFWRAHELYPYDTHTMEALKIVSDGMLCPFQIVSKAIAKRHFTIVKTIVEGSLKGR